MAKKARKKAASNPGPSARRLTVRKELVRDPSPRNAQAPRGAIVINSKAIRGMVIDRSAVSLARRERQ